MLHRWLILALLLAGLSDRAARAADDESQATGSEEQRFLEGLRKRGYHDLAIEYLEALRKAPETPADFKATIDYEEGRCLLDEAVGSGDLERRREVLDRARAKLAAFAEANPKNPLASDALVKMARILVERGHTAVLQANDPKGVAEAQAKLAEARASFASARKAYDQALGQLQKVLDGFPKFIPVDDPRRPAREAAQVAVMDTRLQRALVEYEDAQSYRASASERNVLLDKARLAFEAVYKDYRTQLSGLYAHMWQAKCFEEKGELGAAMGIYKELMDSQAPELRDLQRKVQYFQIIIDGKRGEHTLAVDRASAWLSANTNAQRSDEGLGVKLELAKNLLAQLETLRESDQEIAKRRATDFLGEVVRYYSPYKPEALALLQKYKPKSALNLNQVAALTFDDAMAQAEQAMASHEWDRALTLLRQAVKRADPAKDPDKANRARYFMAYCFFEGQKFYEANVIVEHLAHRYPQGGLSAKSTEIGMEALRSAYSAQTQIDRTGDLNRLAALAKYTTETWPDTEQGDTARVYAGEIAFGQGRYVEAAKAFESVRTSSPRRNDALVRAGASHWRQSLVLADAGKAKDSEAEAKLAVDQTASALKSRQEAGVAPGDPAYVNNVVELAEIHRASGHPKEAVQVLEPVATALESVPKSAETTPLRVRFLTVLMRSHIANGQAPLAINDMKALETLSSDKQSLTQLFFELGRTLQKEMEGKSKAGRSQIQEAYKQFLDALTNSKTGQSYASLEWAGEALLQMWSPEEPSQSRQNAEKASKIFDNVMALTKGDDFKKQPDADTKIIRTRLKKAEALRKSEQFPDALAVIDALINERLSQKKPLLEPMLEKGQILEEWAKLEPSKWDASINYWQRLALQLDRMRPRPVQAFDAWFHVSYGWWKKGNRTKATEVLKSVMILSPSVGSPQMKAKYQKLLRELGG
jgi:TolA-binding protein